jgi:hypothetical protein
VVLRSEVRSYSRVLTECSLRTRHIHTPNTHIRLPKTGLDSRRRWKRCSPSVPCVLACVESVLQSQAWTLEGRGRGRGGGGRGRGGERA